MAIYTGSDRRLAYLFANGGGGGGSCKVISGYYHDGSFYEDQSYTQIITGSEDSLYIDLDTTTLYLFDGTDYVEVQGGGGAVSDGTVGVRIDKSFNAGESKTYTYEELGVTEKGYYILSIATNHAEPYGGWKWYGFLCYSGNTTNNYSYVKQLDSNNINVTMDSVNKTITIQNTNGSLAETFRIEVLPIYPKIKVAKHQYSTTEQVVGTWIDGKPLYETTVSMGTLPNNAWLTVNHGISDIERIVSMDGYACRLSTGTFIPLPYVGSGQVCLNASTSSVAIQTTSDRRDFTESYVTIRYTKSTD